MTDLLRRLVEALGWTRRTRRREGRAEPDRNPAAPPCAYVPGPTTHRTGERPPRGEDSPLVRPYLLAHERQEARRAVLWIAVRGADLDLRPSVRGEATA
ncbi:hypothetical protein [Streptomyces gobitricini]|uniref:Uncharacterized protein n=1 Tax=Streptomyces gobitricini TaxID=68211 RepID=A0ABN3L630_9ACTN